MGKSRSWLGPLCVVASLAAHGALLAMVMPDSNPAPSPTEAIGEEPLDDVAVTVLPKTALELEPAAPKPAAIATALSPAVNPSSPLPAAVQPSSAPTQPSPAPAQQPPRAQPPRVQPPQPQAAASSPTPPSTAVPEPAFTPQPVAPEPEPPGLYANFPHLDGAQAACEGLAACWRSPVSSSWRGAANDLKDRLEAQGYTLQNVTGEVLSMDSGARVYTVSKPGEAEYYLNLVSVREGVLYTMTAEPMTSEQVLALQRS